MNFEDNSGKVMEVFTDGNVNIKVDDLYETYVNLPVTQLSLATPCSGGVCAKSRASFEGNIGTILEVFTNGKAKVQLDGRMGSYFLSTTQLAKSTKCEGGVCLASRVNFEDQIGTAAEVFADGTVKVELVGSDEFALKHTSQLGVSYRCVGNLCVNDRVNFDGNLGTIKEIFSNGKTKVALDQANGDYFLPVSKLGCELRYHN